MAKLALTIAGGILGAVFIPGVGASLGFAIGSALGGIIGQLAFPGKGTHVYGPRVNDLQVSSSAPGAVIPLLFGTMRLGGNIIWSTGLQETTVTTSQSAKGGPSVSQTTYNYTVSFAAGFCQGPAKIARIWADSKLIFDRNGTINNQKGTYNVGTAYAVGDIVSWNGQIGILPPLFNPPRFFQCVIGNTGQLPTNPGFWLDLGTSAPSVNISKYSPPTFYEGDENQLPDPLIVSHEGANFTPAYRGLCYFVWEDLPLADFGNRLPNMRAECTSNGAPSYPMTQIPWTAPSGNAHFMVTDTTGQTLFVWYGIGTSAYYIQRIDLSSNTVVAHGLTSAGLDGLMTVDAAGFLWGIGNSGTAINTLYKLDPWTFQVLATRSLQHVVGVAPLSLTMYVDTQGLSWIIGLGNNNVAGDNELYMMFMVDARDASIAGVYCDVPPYTPHRQPGFTPVPLGADTSVTLDFEQVYPVVDPRTGNTYFIYNWTSQPSNTFGGWVIKVIEANSQATTIFANPTPPPNIPGPLFQNASTFYFAPDPSLGVGHAMFWNSLDNTLLVLTNTGAFIKVDPSTGNILETLGSATNPQFGVTTASPYTSKKIGLSWLTVDNGTSGGALQAAFQGRIKNGLVWAPSLATQNAGKNVLVFSASTLLQIAEYDMGLFANKPQGTGSDWPMSSAGPNGWLYDSVANALLALSDSPITTGGTTFAIYRGFLDRISTAGITADSIVNEICQIATIDAGDIDTSQLASISVEGYPIAQLQAGKDIINTLGQTYFFEGRESDFKLVFVPRGQPSIMNIPESDLGLAADNAAVTEAIQQEQDVPKDVEVLYINPATDYQQGQQKRVRHKRTKKTINKTSISLPLVMTAQQASQLADKMLWTAETERNTYKTNFWKALYLLLDPCDVVTFTYQGLQFTARVTADTIGQNFATAAELTREDSNTYISIVTGTTSSGFQGQVIGILAKTLLWLLDIPYLQDTDADATGNTGYYFAVAPDNSAGAWAAGVLYGSSDNAAWNQIDASTRAVSYGVAQNVLALPTTGVFAWDFVNTLTVRMTGNSTPPSSDTMLNVLNGTNAAILFPSLEIIQFQTVTTNADGTITLSKLLRGRRGTDDFIINHTAGETVFFPLVNAGVVHEQVSLTLLNLLRYYKGITVGADINSNLQSQGFTIQGRDLMPYAPNVFKSQPSGSDILFTWFRRTRLGGALQDGTQWVPLAENSELYSIDVKNGAGTVVRTINGIAPPGGVQDSWTSPAQPHQLYTAAQQAADGYTPGAGWTAVVYQISAQVGRGFPTALALP